MDQFDIGEGLNENAVDCTAYKIMGENYTRGHECMAAGSRF